MTKSIIAADLFAGAGGTSTALRRVCDSRGLKLKLKAVNHWDTAVETHAKNHPEADHICETLDSVDPRKLFPKGLDVLCASPECTNHSNARGGKPCDDQSRSTAWHVLRWAEALRPKVILVENVREFTDWGPLNLKTQRPVKRLKGTIFTQWLNTLRAIGYRAEWRLVNAADFGGATTRTRFFLMAVRGTRGVPWPAKTHEENPTPGLFGPSLLKWRSASEVIDWKLPGKSIFGRKKPLSENTMKRIAEGIRRFWGVDPEPFLVSLRGTAADQLRSTARSSADPVPTLTGGGEHVGVCTGFVMHSTHGGRLHDPADPLPTVTGANRGELSVAQPFIVPQFSENEPRDISRPIGGITTTSRGMGLAQPFILPFEGIHRGNAPRDVGDPLPTITAGRGGGHLVQPFIIPSAFGEHDGQRPRTHDVNSPLPTVLGSNTHALIQPYLVKFNGTGTAYPVTDPLDTITQKDRFGLVTAAGIVADILFRMLQPHELAAAMGFPVGYQFCGNREQIVKQIGNAVEVNKAFAHLMELSYLIAA